MAKLDLSPNEGIPTVDKVEVKDEFPKNCPPSIKEEITCSKEYRVINESEGFYRIANDHNKLVWYNKLLFK